MRGRCYILLLSNNIVLKNKSEDNEKSDLGAFFEKKNSKRLKLFKNTNFENKSNRILV